MTIHREGYFTIIITVLVLVTIHFLSATYLINYATLRICILAVSVIFFLVILQFFRHPRRNSPLHDDHILSPADGKVVVIEETEETEFFKDKRIQVSVFMSPVNVHVNRYPVSGIVTYFRYHAGQYLVAWHPKSSTDNERTTVVIETDTKTPVLVRQIAGALARRIVCYSKKDSLAIQGAEMGFIKFGSRVDVFLPLDAKIRVKLNDVVKGGETVIADLS